MCASKTLIGLHSDQPFQHSFEATTGTRAAARRNQVTVGVEDFKRNCVGELVRVATELDGTREPVCLYPGSRLSMPARTSAAVAPKAAKCFKFLDVILLSPFSFEYR